MVLGFDERNASICDLAIFPATVDGVFWRNDSIQFSFAKRLLHNSAILSLTKVSPRRATTRILKKFKAYGRIHVQKNAVPAAQAKPVKSPFSVLGSFCRYVRKPTLKVSTGATKLLQMLPICLGSLVISNPWLEVARPFQLDRIVYRISLGLSIQIYVSGSLLIVYLADIFHKILSFFLFPALVVH